MLVLALNDQSDTDNHLGCRQAVYSWEGAKAAWGGGEGVMASYWTAGADPEAQ